MLTAAPPSPARALQFDSKVKPQDQPWGIECDDVLNAALAKVESRPLRPCHVMGRDIVVPPSPYEINLRSPFLDQDMVFERNITMFFAGSLPELSQDGSWKHKSDIGYNRKSWYQVRRLG